MKAAEESVPRTEARRCTPAPSNSAVVFESRFSEVMMAGGYSLDFGLGAVLTSVCVSAILGPKATPRSRMALTSYTNVLVHLVIGRGSEMVLSACNEMVCATYSCNSV